MQTVQNIQNIKYFTQQWDIVDQTYQFTVDWPKHNITNTYSSLPTFVSDFSNCSVNSLPVLVTEDRKLITNHVWPLISRYRDKPHKMDKIQYLIRLITDLFKSLDIVHGEKIIVEYVEPADVKVPGRFTISNVIHGYILMIGT